MRAALETAHSRFEQNPLFPELDFPVIISSLRTFDFQQALHQIELPVELKLRAEQAGRRAPFAIQMSLIAVLEAWKQANLLARDVNPEKIGIVIAGSNTTTQGYCYRVAQSLEGLSHLPPRYALHFMDTDHLGILSEAFGVFGESFTVGGASASGNVAIIQGCRLIQQAVLEVCLVVGLIADLSPLEIQAFYNIDALGGRKFKDRPLEACRPFDKESEGFILGQASGCLVLEEAGQDMPAFGYIEGMGFSLDGNRGAEPNHQGEIKAMQQALQLAKLIPPQIDYLNTHGSSSALGDAIEIAAIISVFGNSLEKFWLNATKGIIGHCLWSAGILEAIATLLQLNHAFLHPNMNLIRPIHPQCLFVGEHAVSVSANIAMSNAFYFGGINTSIIFSKGHISERWH
ncbi:MAG: hypothetical protein KBB94_10425 [Legionellaceae bacterium]|nr:hypothetical protein [Legionellaceae bacterium]